MRLPFSSNGKLKMLMIGKLVLFVNFIITLLSLFLCLCPLGACFKQYSLEFSYWRKSLLTRSGEC